MVTRSGASAWYGSYRRGRRWRSISLAALGESGTRRDLATALSDPGPLRALRLGNRRSALRPGLEASAPSAGAIPGCSRSNHPSKSCPAMTAALLPPCCSGRFGSAPGPWTASWRTRERGGSGTRRPEAHLGEALLERARQGSSRPRERASGRKAGAALRREPSRAASQ